MNGAAPLEKKAFGLNIIFKRDFLLGKFLFSWDFPPEGRRCCCGN